MSSSPPLFPTASLTPLATFPNASPNHSPPHSPMPPSEDFASDLYIVAADDDAVNQKILKRALIKIGKGKFIVDVVDNGEKVIDAVRARRPHIILIDLHMPVLSGLDATKILRNDPQFADLPIVAITADAFAHQQQEAMSMGFTEYLTKPINFNHLHSVLCRFLPLASALPLVALEPAEPTPEFASVAPKVRHLPPLHVAGGV
eukprot:TRINITY_DN4634_c0_g1_i5.p1 TRINITY_DN4634_c0_g1~~TRINITY_DN4634_c0_g1_i5.p1  ORF type:complete len:203 (-),score=13.22 TRINITY_DN4634_c0_g1_i5:115-723(-)